MAIYCEETLSVTSPTTTVVSTTTTTEARQLNKCLPYERWTDVIGGGMPNSTGSKQEIGATVGDVLFAIGGLIWQIIGWVVRLGGSSLDWVTSQADISLGFIAGIMPVFGWIVLWLAGAVTVFWSQGKGLSGFRDIFKKGFKLGVCWTLALAVILAAATDAGLDKDGAGDENHGQVPLSPSWMLTMFSEISDPILEGSSRGFFGIDTIPADHTDPLHCERYIEALSYPDNKKGIGDTLEMSVNQMWLTLYYRSWAKSVMGGDEAAARSACRVAEWRSKIPAWEHEMVSCYAADGRWLVAANRCVWRYSGLPEVPVDRGILTVQTTEDASTTVKIPKRVQWVSPAQVWSGDELAEAVTPWIVCQFHASTTSGEAGYWDLSDAVKDSWVRNDGEVVDRFRYQHNQNGLQYARYVTEACALWWNGKIEDKLIDLSKDRCEVLISGYYYCGIDEEARETEIAGYIAEIEEERKRAGQEELTDEEIESLQTSMDSFFAGGQTIPPSLSESELSPPIGGVQDLHRLWAAPPEVTGEDPVGAALAGRYGLNTADKISAFVNAFIFGGIILIVTGMVVLGGLWLLLAAVLLPFVLIFYTLEGRPLNVGKKIFAYGKRGALFTIGGVAVLILLGFILGSIRTLFAQNVYTSASAYTLTGFFMLGVFWIFRTEGAPRAKMRTFKTNIINTYSQAKRDILHPFTTAKEHVRGEVAAAVPQAVDTQYLYTFREEMRRKGANTTSLGWESGTPESWKGVTVNNGRLEALDISDCGLTAIPSSIQKFKFLKRLDCQRNRIMELPSFLVQMMVLRHIDISGTQTLRVDGKPIPDSFGDRTDLTIVVRGCANLEIERVSEKVERLLER